MMARRGPVSARRWRRSPLSARRPTAWPANLSWPLPDFVLHPQAGWLMDSFAPTINATAQRPDASDACPHCSPCTSIALSSLHSWSTRATGAPASRACWAASVLN